MRIIAMLFILVVLAAIVGTTYFVMAAIVRRDNRLNTDATWQVRSSSDGGVTSVEVVLETPDHRVLEKRLVLSFWDSDENYDSLYYNAMEDARSRAFLLNGEE